MRINSLKDIYDALDEFGILYAGINGDNLTEETVYSKYVPLDQSNHAVVITGIGIISGMDGIYIEILNSWGTDVGYDGLQYIKVANDENSYIVNNMNILSESYGIHAERDVLKQYSDTLLALMFIVLFVLTACALIIMIILYIRKSHVLMSNIDDESIDSEDEPPTQDQEDPDEDLTHAGSRSLDTVLI